MTAELIEHVRQVVFMDGLTMIQECVQKHHLIAVMGYMVISIIINVYYQWNVKGSRTLWPECVCLIVHKQPLKSISVCVKPNYVYWYALKYLIILLIILLINVNHYALIQIKLEIHKIKEDVLLKIIVQGNRLLYLVMYLNNYVLLLNNVPMEDMVIIIQWCVKLIVQDLINVMQIL